MKMRLREFSKKLNCKRAEQNRYKVLLSFGFRCHTNESQSPVRGNEV